MGGQKKIADSTFLKSILWSTCRFELVNSGSVQLEFNWVSEETTKSVSFAMPDNQGKHNDGQNPGLELSPQLIEEPCSWSSEHCPYSSPPPSSQGEAEKTSHGVCRTKRVWGTQELTSVLLEPEPWPSTRPPRWPQSPGNLVFQALASWKITDPCWSYEMFPQENTHPYPTWYV